MAQRYQVTLHSQMGPRQSLLALNYAGNYVGGTLALMGCENTVQGVRAEDGTLHIFHTIQTAVSTIHCETVLELRDGALKGTTTADSCQIQWEGNLLADAR